MSGENEHTAVLQELEAISAQMVEGESTTPADVPTKEAATEDKIPVDADGESQQETKDEPKEKEQASKGKEEAAPEPDAQEQLLARAKSYGIPKEKVEAWGDKAKEMVDDISAMIDQRTADFGRSIVEMRKQQAETKTPEAGAKKEEATETPAGSISKALLEEGYTEEDPVYKAMKALEEQNMALQKSLEQAAPKSTEGTDAKLQAEQIQTANDINEFFASIPANLQNELWGGGKLLEVDPASKNAEFVRNIIGTMEVLEAGYSAQGKTLTIKELAEKSFTLLAKDKLRSIHDKDVSDRVKKRNASFTETPAKRNHSKKEAPRTESEAIDELQGLIKEHGMA